MNLFDKASLILTPNAYKASKLYALKPTNGSGDLTFSRASAAMRRNASGLWESVANNVPRLHYPVGGGCPSWLFEPLRTNLVLRNYQFNTSLWLSVGITIDETSIVAPDGTTTGNKITLNSGSGLERFSQTPSGVSAGQVYTLSCYVKVGAYSGNVILRADVSGNTANLIYNLTSGIITTEGGNIIQARAIPEENGWVRLELTHTAVASSVIDLTVFNGGAAGAYYYAWGMQLEVGNSASSPILTAGSVVTRVGDTFEAPLLGGAQGTIFIKNSNSFVYGNNVSLYNLFNSGWTDGFGLFLNGDGTEYSIRDYGDTGAPYPAFNRPAPNKKIVISWNGNVLKVYSNGVLQVTNTRSLITPYTINKFALLNGLILNPFALGEVVYYNIQLTDSECLALIA